MKYGDKPSAMRRLYLLPGMNPNPHKNHNRYTNLTNSQYNLKCFGNTIRNSTMASHNLLIHPMLAISLLHVCMCIIVYWFLCWNCQAAANCDSTMHVLYIVLYIATVSSMINVFKRETPAPYNSY